MDIPGFQIRRTIGRGGMATAHLALQESLGREVVLKTMDASVTEGSSDFVSRFMNEGRIVASLRHPNIITVYDIGQAGDVVWLAMEYIDGGDLKSRIKGPMDPDTALEIVERLAAALDYAHGRGVVHRDVKPANILFRGDGTPLLSDFGIAKQVTRDPELTSTGTILGSPFYMSPEQAEGRPIDGRTDLYSLGVILYEMLTGERPYQGDSAIKVIMQHLQAPLPVLPEELSVYQPLIERLMAKRRERRPASGAAVVAEVARLRARLARERSAPQQAARSSRGTAESRRRRLRMRLAVGLGCVLVLLAAFTVFAAYTQSLRPTLVRRAAGPGDGALPAAALGDEASARARIAEESDRARRDQGEARAGTVRREDVVKALLWLARDSMREDRLTQPPANNALYYYSRLLAMDPDNPEARKGLSAIAERFVVLAEQAYSRRDYGKAQAYIALGLQVEPDNPGLRDLQTFIENRKEGLLDRLLALLRG